MLRVSERTIRRRCEAGKMAARLETTKSGAAWMIDPEEVRTLWTSAAIGADTSNEAEQQNTLRGADTADKLRTGAAISADKVLLDHVLDENRRLWLALEAAQQSEAVTKAALRELLKAQPKQLSQGTGEGARNGQQHSQNGEAGSYGPKASDGAKTGGNGGESLSYGDIADLLEKEMNG